DTATIERIEFLKGPAAALYGSSEPGGTINIVTKKPQFTRKNSAELSAGTGGLRRATVDSTGPLSQNLAYRLIAMTEEGDSRSSLL
ncbi:TonB-dependent receptor plug domain-containing protein, partial [Escherichia coli]